MRGTIQSVVKVLAERGPNLGRPYVDTLKNTGTQTLKELRVQHGGKSYRIVFFFGETRTRILLVGGCKEGAKDKDFYARIIRIALQEMENL